MKKLIYMFETMAFVPPSELDNKELKSKNYHYYFIVSSPMKYIDDVYEKNGEIAFLLNDGEKQFEVIMHYPNRDYDIENVTFKYKIPRDKRNALLSYDIKFKNGKTKKITDGFFPALGVYTHFHKKQSYRIEYIGQSYARDGHRTAQERLSSHSTLQKVLSDALNEGGKEIGLFLFGADISCLDNTGITNKESSIFQISDVNLEITADHVNLFEAYLINTFKPKYNEKFKTGIIPSQSHHSYKKVIDEDYDDFSVNFGIIDLNNDYKFYTDHKTIEIVNGTLSGGAMKVLFKEANVVDDEKYIYSFMNI